MFGTEDGLWYAFNDNGDGTCDYSFHLFGDEKETGTDTEENVIGPLFDKFCNSQRH